MFHLNPKLIIQMSTRIKGGPCFNRNFQNPRNHPSGRKVTIVEEERKNSGHCVLPAMSKASAHTLLRPTILLNQQLASTPASMNM